MKATPQEIANLRTAMHLSSGWETSLGIRASDIYCFAEHTMMGSTAEVVDDPWMTYAAIAGKSLDWVNRERALRNLKEFREGYACGGFISFGIYFNLPVSYLVFCENTLLNPKTGLVDSVKPWAARDRRTMQFLPEAELEKLFYVGPFANLLKR